MVHADEPSVLEQLLLPNGGIGPSDEKLAKAWSHRRDEIEELKKIFFEFLKKWIDDQRSSIPYNPKFYDRTVNDAKYQLPKGIIRDDAVEECSSLSPQKTYRTNKVVARPEEFSFDRKVDRSDAKSRSLKMHTSQSLDKRRSAAPGKNNRSMDNTAEIDEILEGNWNSNTTSGSALARGNSLLRRMTMRQSKVSTLLEVQDISSSRGRKSSKFSKPISGRGSFRARIN